MVRSTLASIVMPIYTLLQLWFGTAHSIVVYIVPVFKNILFPFLYSFPQVRGINSMTLHILDSRTTQGTYWAHLVKACLPRLRGERVAAIPQG